MHSDGRRRTRDAGRVLTIGDDGEHASMEERYLAEQDEEARGKELGAISECDPVRAFRIPESVERVVVGANDEISRASA
jgi:hypothetical protein